MRRYLALLAVTLASAIIAGGITYAVSNASRPQDSAIDRAYRAGLDALARNDFAHAIDQLGQVSQMDSKYKDVQALLARARQGATPQPPTTPATTAPPPVTRPPTRTPVATTAPVGRPQDLSVLLPVSIAGFGSPQIENTPDLVTAIFLPTGRSPIHAVTITIMDRKSAASATGFVTNTIKVVYSADKSDISIGPNQLAYFGTSGGLYATVGWSKGTLAYQVLVETESGSPRALRGTARTIAQSVR